MEINWIELVLGWLLGMLTPIALSYVNKVIKKVKDRRYRKGVFNYNPESDGLYMVNRWSLERPLTKSTHKVKIQKAKPFQDFIPAEELQKRATDLRSENKSGDICFLTDYQIDHKESAYGENFEITVCRCDYSEHLASYYYLEEHPEIKNKIADLLRTDPKKYLANAIPSNITVNAVVISEDKFLAIKRSTSVDTAKNIWTVGPFETMVLKPELTPGSDYDIYSLTKRCLFEEVNLKEDQYGEIFISWFGILLSSLRTHIVAVIKIKNISESSVIASANNAHSNYESEQFEWLPFTHQGIKDLVENESGQLSDREWIKFTALSLQEAWRVRQFV